MKEYIKNAIRFICEGDSKFYYEYEKELFRRLMSFINERIISHGIFSQEALLEMIVASNKTITNVGLGAETVNANLRRFIREEARKLEQSDNLPFSVKIVQNEKECSLDAIGTALFMEIVGKQAQHISGSLKSEFGKEVEKIYLDMIFESLGVSETSKNTVENLQISGSSLLEGGLYYVRGGKFKVINDQVRYYGRGKEVDAMVYLYDQNNLSYLLATEFSLSGRGNPTFQRNKANDMHVKFEGNVGLVYTAFDLGVDMRGRIEEDVKTIFFKDDTGSTPLLKIFNLIGEQLENRGHHPDSYLPSWEEAEKEFKELISQLSNS